MHADSKPSRNGRSAHAGKSAVVALALGGALVCVGDPAVAADHTDAPLTADDHAADLADLYAWHTDRGTVVAVLTFAPLLAPGDAPVYDADVVYVIHIDNTASPAERAQYTDNDNDNASDIRIQARFGQNDQGDWGVQLIDVPGSEGTFEGPVETTLTSGSARAMAGMFDDPFFFDLEGFLATRTNLMSAANPDDFAFASLTAGAAVDTFAGTNTMAIVVELDAAIAVGGNPSSYLQLWATSGSL